MTLTHLRVLARNYNLSYGIDAQFQSLARETQAVALAVNQSQAAMQGDLSHLKTWMQKTQRRSWKVESRLLALGAALSERGKQRTQEGKEPQVQRGALSGLAPDLRALQDTLARLTHLVQGQGARLAALEGRLQVACPGTVAPGLTPARPPTPPGLPSPSSPTLQRGRQVLRPSPETGDPPQDSASGLQGTRALPGPGSQRAWPPERPGESKYHGLPLLRRPRLSPLPPPQASGPLWTAFSPELCGEDTGFTALCTPRRKGGCAGDGLSSGPPAPWGGCAQTSGAAGGGRHSHLVTPLIRAGGIIGRVPSHRPHESPVLALDSDGVLAGKRGAGSPPSLGLVG